MPFVVKFLAAALVLLSSQALAQDDADIAEHVWKLSKINGKAWIEANNREPMLVRKNRKLFPGQTLTTATRTRLLLTRGKERIQVSSNTVLSLPTASRLSPGNTIIMHKKGSLHLSVEKKNVKHFAVHTPYMVAAVKGTKFSVSIARDVASLRVQEGVVEVKNKLANQIADVTAGQSVSINLAMAKFKTASLGRQVKIPMTILDRGEDHPSVVAERARARMRRDAGFLGNMIGVVADTTHTVVSTASGIFAGVVGYVTGFLVSIFGSAIQAGEISYWVRLILSAVMVGSVLGGILMYIALRRKSA